jgi:hypothetical protein
MSRSACVKSAHRLLFQSPIDEEPIADATTRLAVAGQAERQLDADELAALRREPSADCDRCHRPFFDDRMLMTLTGHYVSGSDWELCLACTSDLMRWLGRDVTGLPLEVPPSPEPRTKHQ